MKVSGDKKLKVRDPCGYLIEGARIARAFKEEGLTTNQSIAVMNLYQRNYLRKELMGIVEIKNEGQFSRDVIMPLKEKGYIEILRGKDSRKRIVRITPNGKGLVERILEVI